MGGYGFVIKADVEWVRNRYHIARDTDWVAEVGLDRY